MKLTSGKLRYLLTIASLGRNSQKVRCIDVAVQLGVSRASVCKMLSSLCKEGILYQHSDKSLHITTEGQILAEEYAARYRQIYPAFQQMGLSEFDSQECAMALLSQLPEQTLKNVCSALSSPDSTHDCRHSFYPNLTSA